MVPVQEMRPAPPGAGGASGGRCGKQPGAGEHWQPSGTEGNAAPSGAGGASGGRLSRCLAQEVVKNFEVPEMRDQQAATSFEEPEVRDQEVVKSVEVALKNFEAVQNFEVPEVALKNFEAPGVRDREVARPGAGKYWQPSGMEGKAAPSGAGGASGGRFSSCGRELLGEARAKELVADMAQEVAKNFEEPEVRDQEAAKSSLDEHG